MQDLISAANKDYKSKRAAWFKIIEDYNTLAFNLYVVTKHQLKDLAFQHIIKPNIKIFICVIYRHAFN